MTKKRSPLFPRGVLGHGVQPKTPAVSIEYTNSVLQFLGFKKPDEVKIAYSFPKVAY